MMNAFSLTVRAGGWRGEVTNLRRARNRSRRSLTGLSLLLSTDLFIVGDFDLSLSLSFASRDVVLLDRHGKSVTFVAAVLHALTRNAAARAHRSAFNFQGRACELRCVLYDRIFCSLEKYSRYSDDIFTKNEPTKKGYWCNEGAAQCQELSSSNKAKENLLSILLSHLPVFLQLICLRVGWISLFFFSC